jgi:acetylornithine deacetylase/succinyl-diaminopimelate desuccinylase-like protein
MLYLLMPESISGLLLLSTQSYAMVLIEDSFLLFLFSLGNLGRLYGRGAGDMKAGIVCFVIALKALEKLGWRPAADVTLQTVVEEECTGNGTLACLERGYKADLALIPEPFPFLITAQLGVVRECTIHCFLSS